VCPVRLDRILSFHFWRAEQPHGAEELRSGRETRYPPPIRGAGSPAVSETAEALLTELHITATSSLERPHPVGERSKYAGISFRLSSKPHNPHYTVNI